MKKACTFNYSEHMKQYRKENNVKNKIEFVELLNTKQLKNKFPKFTIRISTEYGNHESTVKTRKLSDSTFQVVEGWGQLSFGIIELV